MEIEKKVINEDAIGYCGVFCGGCPSYHAGTCHGCRSNIQKQKRISKWKCRKRLCCIDKKIYSCGDCSELIGCKIRKSLVENYKTNYNLDLDLNSKKITKLGGLKWLDDQKKLYKCNKCGGILSPYDNKCIYCKKNQIL